MSIDQIVRTFTKAVIRNESELILAIKAMQNSLRLIGVIPTFYNFKHCEGWPTIAQQLAGSEMRKFEAWWNLIVELQRGKEDQTTLMLAVAYLVKERQRRSYSKEIAVNPIAFGITDEQHSQQVREHVLRYYEALNPDLAPI